MRNNSGLLVVFSGPSGVGKDSLLQRLLEVNPQIRLSVSATTRSPRGEEQHGKDYFFLSKEEFQEMIDQDGMLEYALYCENYYGTPRQPVEEGIKQGQDVILEIEVQGGAQVRQQNPASVSIFVLPPSMKVLSQRLHKRGTDSEEVIQKRLQKAREEIRRADQYDYVVMNDDLEECVQEICEILSAEKKKASRSENFIEDVLNNE